MSSESNRPLVSLLDELDRLPGVRGALVATVYGAYQASERWGFDAATATDRAKPVRTDVTFFNAVAVDFELAGVTQSDAETLIERFRGR